MGQSKSKVADILKLNIDCFEEVFYYLPFEDFVENICNLFKL